MRRLPQKRSDESGIAMITVLMMLFVLTALVVAITIVAVHSNDATQNDSRRENAFGAATAGVDDALRCLQQLNPSSPVSTCNLSAGPGTTLTDAGSSIGQYQVTVTDLTPGLSTKTVQIVSTAWGPTKNSISAARTVRTVSAEVTLTPVGGFFDAVFAGGTSPAGLVSFKNGATITSGTVYARSFDTQKNGASLVDLQVVGDVVTKNGDVYHSIWSGGSLTLANNSVVQTNAQACGAGTSPGDATLSNGSRVVGNLRYKGTYNGGGSAGSTTHAGCSAPPALALPTFSYNAANYPGWTIVNFINPVTANSCLATATASQLAQIAACGVALGDANGTVGKNASGTLIYINVPGCAVPIAFGDAVFSGNFTIVTNCKLQPTGTYTRSPLATGPKQAAFISTSATGADDLSGSPTSADPTLSVLLYTAGDLSTKNNISIASGAMYGSTVTGKNSITIGASTDLGNNPPPGFTFDAAVATKYLPVVTLWQQN